MSTRLRIRDRQRAVTDTCDEYRRMATAGGEPSEIVTGLAAFYSVNRPAIWKRLRSGGLLPPYATKTGVTRKRRPTKDIDAERDSQPRVERDPCPRCGVRKDFGCGHSHARLGTVL